MEKQKTIAYLDDVFPHLYHYFIHFVQTYTKSDSDFCQITVAFLTHSYHILLYFVRFAAALMISSTICGT